MSLFEIKRIKSVKLFVIGVFVLSCIFAFFSGNQTAQSAAACDSQWFGPQMTLEVRIGNSSGPVILNVDISDPGVTGQSNFNGNINVAPGTVLWIKGVARAYESNSPSTMTYPGGVSNFFEGPFAVDRIVTTAPISSSSTFDWDIYSVCQGAPGPNYGGSEGHIHLDIGLASASNGTINVVSNQSTCWLITGPNNFNACGTNDSYSAATGSYSIAADDLTCYSKSINASPQNLTSGATITFTITYTNTCGGGGSPPGPFALSGGGCFNGGDSVEINFFASAGADYYELQRRTTGSFATIYSGTYAQLDAYTDSVAPNTVYEYRVVAYNSYGSTASNTTMVINTTPSNCTAPPPPPPPPPTSCTDNATVAPTPANLGTLQPGQTASVSFRVTSTGNVRWYHGSAYQFVQNSSLNISPTYGHLPNGMWPTWTADWTFTLTAPATAGNYNLTMQMVHRAGWDYIKPDGTICSPPGADVKFGQVGTVSFTVAATPPPPPLSMAFAIVYTPMTLNTPTGVTVSRSCPPVGNPNLIIGWSYVTNGAEDGFTVYRSTDDLTWTAVSPLLGAAARTYTDTPSVLNVRYYYMVRAHRTINPPESPNSVSANILDAPCTADLSQSTKTLITVNGSPYNPAASLKNNDVLRFRITVVNSGLQAATINYINDTLSSNLVLPSSCPIGSTVANWCLRVDKDGDGNYNESGESGTVSGTAPNIRFNVSGSKPVGVPNWFIEFDATLVALSSGANDLIKNIGVINYTDSSGTFSKIVQFGPILFSTPSGVPNFREVAP